MTTLVKTPVRNGLRTLTPSWYNNPLDRFFRNDFLDLWDGDHYPETIPSLNITEEKDNFKIELAAPGLKKDDFNIEVDGNLITISCEKETESNVPKNGNNYSRREYNYSCFSRSFTIPENTIDTNKIVAKYNDGILHLNIPKKQDAQKNNGQKIKVQ